MANDVTSLEVRIQSLEAEVASNRLNALTKSGKKAEGAAGRLTSKFTSLVAPLAALVSVTSAFNKLIGDTRSLDKLEAGLITATGSAEKAAEQFKVLERFATTTPYALDQSVEAFVKLTNLGLTPSERALRSYGNTASAMGKDLSQMIEAVADAATGEFERLKEFGIKSSRQGDKVSFTFRGVSTTIANNAAAIEEHLTRLGENNFSDAMNQRMATLDGALSNLGDEWDRTFRIISKSNIGDSIEGQARGATSALTKLNDGLKLILQDGFFSSDLETLRDEREAAINRMIEAQEMFGKSIKGSKLEEELNAQLSVIEEQIFALETRAGIFTMPMEIPIEKAAVDDPDDILAQNLFNVRENERQIAEVKKQYRELERREREQFNRLAYSTGASFFASIASLESGNSKASFERQKKWMYAETVLSTIASAQAAYYSALKIPGVGLVGAGIAAGVAALAGAARLSQIQKTSYNTGSSPTAAGGIGGSISPTGTPSEPAQATQQAPVTNITRIELGGRVLAEVVTEGNKIAFDNDLQTFETENGFERVVIR